MHVMCRLDKGMQYAIIEITFDLNKIHVKLGIKSNVLNFMILNNCHISKHEIMGISSVGRALVSKTKYRWFDSSMMCSKIK